jgi:hypothetical protein
MHPNFIVIGGQKAGSTWVAEVLGHHPDVFMYPTEIPFFEDPDYSQSTLDDLAKFFDGAAGKQALGMKRPSLLTRPECPARIAHDLPGAKLIAMLRHPVERAVSSYFHLMRSGFLPIAPMEVGMRRVISGEYDRSWPAGRERMMGYGFYHAGIMRYLAHVPRPQLLIVLYDRIRSDAAGLFREMCRFLGVDELDQPAALDRRVMEGNYSIPRQRLVAPLRAMHRRVTPDKLRNYERKGPLAAAARVVTYGVDRYMLAGLFTSRRPTPSVEIQQQLIEIYRSDVVALGEFLGEDLSHWLRVREPATG